MRNTLRLLVFTLSFTLCSLNLHSQWISIPDTNFGKWLNTNGYSQCLQGNSTSGWQMDTTCPAVVGATNINCTNFGVKSFSGLEYFHQLLEFNCYGNPLDSLPRLPESILSLACTHCNLSFIRELPPSLIAFECSHNNLTKLPILPPLLETGHFSFNMLDSLPSLPSTLQVVSCDNNILTTLPTLPDSLITLNCYYNRLQSLPSLPTKLTSLLCSVNYLTQLPTIPNNRFVFIAVDSNYLTSLPEVPDTVDYLLVQNNPALFCLPQLKNIGQLEFYNTGITCLPNYGTVNYSTTPLLNFPLCGAFNENGCPLYWNVTGKVFYDENANCSLDGADITQANLKIRLSGGAFQQAITNLYGYYSFDIDSFSVYDVSLDTSEIPFRMLCPTGGSYSVDVAPVDSLFYSLDFSLECKAGFDAEARSIIGNAFRPATNTLVNITAGDASNFYNAHCAAGISGSVTLTYTGPVQFVSAAPNALTPIVSGNTLTWNIADFGNINFFTDFNIVMHTDTNAQIGQQVCFTLTVNPIAGDNNPANNTLTICFPIVNSYDPNDKTAYPAGDIDTAQKELTYTIRFQNTGNAEAQHIYITDTLDSDVDASTFQLLAYSHQPMVQLKENALRFNFPNINLPDSNTNEPLSHGYVQYKVKLKPNLPVGTVIHNSAYIYFDFNAPVITNTTTNTISLNTGIASIGLPSSVFRLFPNPTNNNVTISIPESLIGSTATVSDVMGRVVSSVLLSTVNHQLSTNDFGSGVYFVTVSATNGTNAVKKLVKE